MAASPDLATRVLHNLLARAPKAAPGQSGAPAPPAAEDPARHVAVRLRDGQVHATRDLIDPLPDTASRQKALSALRRMARNGVVSRVGFGRWQIRSDLAASTG